MAEVAPAKKDVKKTPAKTASPKKESAPAKAPKSAAPKKEAAPKKPAAKAAAPVLKALAKAKKAPKGTGNSVNVYSLDGKVAKSMNLPAVFNTDFRPDLIRKAVNASRANRRQPYGPSPRAGMRHSVSWPGKGRGMARTPRLQHGGGKGAEVPNAPGGRRAHPPRPEKDWSEKVNKKEKALALQSALAAVGHFDVVRARGHRLADGMTVPMVVTDDFETLFDRISDDYQKENKRPALTKETVKVLEALGLTDEMTRAKDGIHQRAGRGKARGRRFKSPKSILFVVHDTEKAIKCLGNIPGVDIVSPA
ncbi:MAG: 50S ribosomal protein L4, partial [Candidatus Thermoplasmatota archaeon]|nr:50S ribosomal protein L4 [Candidatus Thermoplasmatota archaeon]